MKVKNSSNQVRPSTADSELKESSDDDSLYLKKSSKLSKSYNAQHPFELKQSGELKVSENGNLESVIEEKDH